MADTKMTDEEIAARKKKRTFRKFFYRGVELDNLLELSNAELIDMLPAGIRRRFQRGLAPKYIRLLKKLRKAKKEAGPLEKPVCVNTHLRDMIVMPEMIGSVVGVYSGKVFGIVEIKPEMIGHYLGEFSISYKPTLHGRPGLAANHGSKFIPI